jgi:hypothetical protein
MSATNSSAKSAFTRALNSLRGSVMKISEEEFQSFVKSYIEKNFDKKQSSLMDVVGRSKGALVDATGLKKPPLPAAVQQPKFQQIDAGIKPLNTVSDNFDYPKNIPFGQSKSSSLPAAVQQPKFQQIDTKLSRNDNLYSTAAGASYPSASTKSQPLEYLLENNKQLNSTKDSIEKLIKTLSSNEKQVKELTEEVEKQSKEKENKPQSKSLASANSFKELFDLVKTKAKDKLAESDFGLLGDTVKLGMGVGRFIKNKFQSPSSQPKTEQPEPLSVKPSPSPSPTFTQQPKFQQVDVEGAKPLNTVSDNFSYPKNIPFGQSKPSSLPAVVQQPKFQQIDAGIKPLKTVSDNFTYPKNIPFGQSKPSSLPALPAAVQQPKFQQVDVGGAKPLKTVSDNFSYPKNIPFGQSKPPSLPAAVSATKPIAPIPVNNLSKLAGSIRGVAGGIGSVGATSLGKGVVGGGLARVGLSRVAALAGPAGIAASVLLPSLLGSSENKPSSSVNKPIPSSTSSDTLQSLSSFIKPSPSLTKSNPVTPGSSESQPKSELEQTDKISKVEITNFKDLSDILPEALIKALKQVNFKTPPSSNQPTGNEGGQGGGLLSSLAGLLLPNSLGKRITGMAAMSLGGKLTRIKRLGKVAAGKSANAIRAAGSAIAGSKVGQAVAKAGSAIAGSKVGQAVAKAGSAIAGSKVGQAVTKAGSSIGQAVTKAGSSVGQAVTKAGSAIVGSKPGQMIAEGAKKAIGTVKNIIPTKVAAAATSTAVGGAASAVGKQGAKKGLMEVIKKIVPKALGKMVGKSIPILGAAIGGALAVGRLIKGDVAGAALEAASGLGGPLTAIPATIALIAKDIYSETYGISPEKDPQAGERMTEVKEKATEFATNLIKGKKEEVDQNVSQEQTKKTETDSADNSSADTKTSNIVPPPVKEAIENKQTSNDSPQKKRKPSDKNNTNETFNADGSLPSVIAKETNQQLKSETVPDKSNISSPESPKQQSKPAMSTLKKAALIAAGPIGWGILAHKAAKENKQKQQSEQLKSETVPDKSNISSPESPEQQSKPAMSTMKKAALVAAGPVGLGVLAYNAAKENKQKQQTEQIKSNLPSKMEMLLQTIANNTGSTNSNITKLINGFNSLAQSLESVTGKKIAPIQSSKEGGPSLSDYAIEGNKMISSFRQSNEIHRFNPV